ncbi:Inositol polyphosphate-5-phosphatase type I [Carabus blaptoides fortunei]
MGTKNIPVLFVTANVGSIFEDPTEMLKYWTHEFLSTVSKLDPKFIALHCQEVGGKNYEKSMKYVEDFVKLLMTSEELRLFDRVRVFIDEDYSSAEHFTALGNIYFVHASIDDVFIWDFKELEFVTVNGAEINTGNIENVVTKEKAKFPQDFFPECKWSRKGFLRTRWSINGTVFDLINIHLFHDASNFIAMESFPSVYCKNRRRALEHTLQRFHSDKHGTAPFFVFGDFNFRMDTDSVVKKLTQGLTTTKILHHKTNDYAKLQFHNDQSQLVLTVGKKEFNHTEHQDVFLASDGSWLKSYDRELEAFENRLFEFPVTFPPSYPFEEMISCGATYMQTRCPAWCDRVLLSHTAKTLVSEESTIDYNIIGRDTCMGDHKPVYLRLNLHSESGLCSDCKTNNITSPVIPVTTAVSSTQPIVPHTRYILINSINNGPPRIFRETAV